MTASVAILNIILLPYDLVDKINLNGLVVIQQIIQYIQVDVLSHHWRKVCLPKVLEKCQPTYLYLLSFGQLPTYIL